MMVFVFVSVCRSCICEAFKETTFMTSSQIQDGGRPLYENRYVDKSGWKNPIMRKSGTCILTKSDSGW